MWEGHRGVFVGPVEDHSSSLADLLWCLENLPFWAWQFLRQAEFVSWDFWRLWVVAGPLRVAEWLFVATLPITDQNSFVANLIGFRTAVDQPTLECLREHRELLRLLRCNFEYFRRAEVHGKQRKP